MRLSPPAIVTAFCSLFAIAAGITVQFGWAFDLVVLTSIVPGFVAMNPVTAVAFTFTGFALWLTNTPSKHALRISRGIGVVVATLGLFRLNAYIFGANFGIDQLLFREALGGNRMAPNTAFCFLLIGCSLALLDVQARRRWWPAQILALIVATVSLLSVVGYGYGAESLYQIPSYIPMALNTAAVFEAVSIGIMFSRPQQGLLAVVLDDGLGGAMARRLLPIVITIPCVLGWLRIMGQQAGFYDMEFGAALMVVMTIVLLLAAMAWSAAVLNRTDLERRNAAEAIRALNDDLERRVLERTAELAIANRDLAQKNQENEMFVYSVSHDLRSPLVNLQGFSKELSLLCEDVCRLLAAGSPPDKVQGSAVRLLDEDMPRCIHFIQTAVTRLSGIIDALLRLSRAGRVEYQLQPVDLDRTVERIVESMSGTIFDRAAKVTIEELSAVRGDPTAIEQVFANLIGNALNYLDPQRPGIITIRRAPIPPDLDIASSDTMQAFVVEDNGVGIAAAYHHKVFQAFKRLQPEMAQGEGMGLAIVRRIVERHGGAVSVQSEPGKGSKFFVVLPTCAAGASAQLGLNQTPERNKDDAYRSVGHLVG